MKTLIFALVIAATASADIICLPYSDAALKALQSEPTAQSGVLFGIPVIETSKTGRRICFAHPFATTDETTGLRRPSDLKWAQTKIEPVAVTAGIAASKDSAATITAKVAAAVKTTAALPVDWSPIKEGETPPDLKPSGVKPTDGETVKIIR